MLGGGSECGRRGDEICTSPHRFERIERMKDFFGWEVTHCQITLMNELQCSSE
jgi:hypothetical protein